MSTIIITGGGGHLGRRVASWWAKPGVHLVLIDRDVEKLARIPRELPLHGATLELIEADVSVPSELEAAVASLPESVPGPPSLVLTHAISGKSAGAETSRIGTLDPVQWSEVLRVNLTSIIFVIQAFLPMMRKSAGGRIVLVTSTAGMAASKTAALSYSVSKAAISALPRLLAPELALSKILINGVAPGKFFNPDWPDEAEKVGQYEKGIPLGRLASAEEVAALIGFLSSEANTYVTGQTIAQDGGRLAGVP